MDAKVDIRKLQLLNDRICQMIEALNQVRLSVHGITHSVNTIPGVTGIPTQLGTVPAVNPALGLVPNLGVPITQNPLAALTGQTPTVPFFPQQLGFGGLTHTSEVDVFGRPVDPFAAMRTVDPLLALRSWFPYGFNGILPIY